MTEIEYLERRIDLLESYLYLSLDLQKQLMPPAYESDSINLWNEFVDKTFELKEEYDND